jgi:hypothetical protein
MKLSKLPSFPAKDAFSLSGLLASQLPIRYALCSLRHALCTMRARPMTEQPIAYSLKTYY